MEAPIVETPRLLMRAHRLDDFEQSFAMWSDPVVTRYIGGKPSTEQQTWSRLLNYAGHWSLLGFGYWALEEKSTGRFAGDVGFANFRRDIAASMRDVPEIGWTLAPSFYGKGYATEAVRAAVAWGDVRFESARTVCLINEGNLASIRVAQKCGYEVFERTTFNEQPTLFLARAGAGDEASR
ncbi:MAG TPA: GNAT family N-acetyltransferase [Candidatus Elarobacter sp.]|jgi:RimJ/RimL family protein N-acetyltransferase